MCRRGPSSRGETGRNGRPAAGIGERKWSDGKGGSEIRCEERVRVAKKDSGREER